ncbi:rhomboid family intramembrane serine protease [Levilactobacillus bambusae]|uniref:Rhomboid family intramembrane serine protease n=1 Tax=Levilactobacillus bambusae TaxID=2024736 RepID=A0A2V1N136_9LACO|nr:rhomboid family intramembrane serine protease [Levilactobacillus bambusae]PWG01001.1 rhomboid family intramembrane serine protease [Levilactobacillus bambusae]
MQQLNRLNRQPWVTELLLVAMVVMFIIETLAGGSESTSVLIMLGAKVNPLIQAGEWWRLITAAFLHIGFTHLLINGITFYYLGSEIERLFGHWRFTVIFLVSAIGGNLASFAFSNAISAGASTAIFGLFGAYLMLGESFWENAYIRQMTKTFLLFIGMNLVTDIFIPGVDLMGHLGGLTAGFLVAYSVENPKTGPISIYKRITASIVLIIGLVWLYLRGMNGF